jgi:hypothetical protein
MGGEGCPSTSSVLPHGECWAQNAVIRILASLHAVGVEPDPPKAHQTVVFRDGGPASTPAVPREAAIMRIAAQNACKKGFVYVG